MPRADLPPALRQLLTQTRAQLRQKHRINAALAITCGLSLSLVLGIFGHALGFSPVFLGLGEFVFACGVLSFSLFWFWWRSQAATRHESALAGWIDQQNGAKRTGPSFQSALELYRDRGRFSESEILTDHVIAEVEEQCAQVDYRTLVASYNWPTMQALLLAATAAFLAISILGSLRPKDLRGAISALESLASISEELAAQKPRLRLGNFVISYRSPSYSERPAQTRNSSSGKIRALPGTEVIIKTSAGQSLQSATLLVGLGAKGDLDQQRTAAKISDDKEQRGIIASFIISRSGRYTFEARGSDGEVYVEGQSHKIELEPDLPPRVRMSKPSEDVLEVNLKDLVHIEFSAHDDFGLGDVSIAWRILGSSREGHQLLSTAGNGEKELRSEGVFDLSKLKLTAGDRIAYSVEAQDNDSVNGPKLGASATRELRVYSERAHHREVLALQEKALDELIHVLGDNLEKPFGIDLSAKEIKALLSSAQTILKRVRATEILLVDVVAAINKDPLGRKEVATAFEKTRRDLKRDRRQESFSIDETERQFKRAQSATKSQLNMNLRAQNRMIRSLEKNVVYLADLLNDQRLLDAEELTKALREQQESLRDALEEYRSAPSDEKKQALLDAIKDIKRRMAEIMAELSRIRGSIPQDFVNQDALKTDDTLKDMDQIEKMIQEGNLDEAMQKLEEMLNSSEKMLSEMRDGRQELGDREYAEATKKAKELYRELHKIEKKQRELSRKTSAKADKLLERMKKRLGDPEAFIKKQLKRIERVKEKLKQAREGAHFSEGDAFDQAERRVKDAERALKAKDFGATKDMAEQSMKLMGQVLRETRQRAENMRRFGPISNKDEVAQKATNEIKQALPPMKKILDDIEKLMPKPQEMFSQQERQQMKNMAAAQSKLQQRAEKMKQKLSELAQELPMLGEGLPKMLDQAGQAMGRSSSQLSQGDAPGSRGQQQKALDALNQFRDALEQMAQQGQGQGGGMPMPFAPPGMGAPGGRGGRGRDPRSKEKVAIPKPEQYRAPAEFREEILEAAKQGTVQEYKEAVRQYYEEIVK